MSCLIYASNSEGCTGRCDANCHNATSPECHCICGGMNHGVGLSKARENTQKYVEEWIDDWEKKHPGDKCSIDREAIYQLALF
jgi:hypothetical protein